MSAAVGDHSDCVHCMRLVPTKAAITAYWLMMPNARTRRPPQRQRRHGHEGGESCCDPDGAPQNHNDRDGEIRGRVSIQGVAQWRQSTDQHEVSEQPSRAKRRRPNVLGDRLHALPAAHISEHRNGGTQCYQEAKAPVLSHTDERAKALRFLSTVEVNECIEKYLVGEEERSEEREPKFNTRVKSGIYCR